MTPEQQLAQAQAAFLNWVKFYSPRLYRAVIESSKLDGIFDSFKNINWSGVIDKTVDLSGQYLQFDQQKALLKLQAERAKAGLLPYGTPPANVVTVQNPPTSTQQRTEELTAMLVRALPWLLGGIILLKFLPARK